MKKDRAKTLLIEASLLTFLLLLPGCIGNTPKEIQTSAKITSSSIPAINNVTATKNVTTSLRTTSSRLVTTTTLATRQTDCNDSDGRNIYITGSVTGYSGKNASSYNLTDKCVNDTTILEYTCYYDGTYQLYSQEEIDCPLTTECLEGRCVKEKDSLFVPATDLGTLVTGLSDQGYLVNYLNYKFKIEGFLYHQDSISGISLDVMRPDGTTTIVQASELMSGILASDSLEISFPGEQASDYGSGKTAAVYVRTAIENPPGSNATMLLGVSDKGFLSGYEGYKFRIDRFIHNKESDITGIKVDVQRPDGAIISPEISMDAYIKVDKILVSFPSRHFVETADEKRADLYVWNSTGAASEKVDLSGIGVALMSWDKFGPQVSTVKYTETGKYETAVKNAFGAEVYIESVSVRDEKSGKDCELVRANGLPVDKGSALDVGAGDSFKITAQCPRKSSDDRYQVGLTIAYNALSGGVKTSYTEAGEIKGIVEL